MNQKEITDNVFNTINSQYKLWKQGFINEYEWTERREMGYLILMNMFNLTRDEILDMFLEYTR